MFLEVDFEDGQVGRYPCSVGATVTVQEPNQDDGTGVTGPGPTFTFALSGVKSIELVDQELSPEASVPPAEPDPVPPLVGEPVTPPPADPVPDPAPVEVPPAEADAPIPDSPAAQTEAAAAGIAIVQTLDTPEAQLAHAQGVVADLQAALEKWPADPGLTDALGQAQQLVTDLTPPPPAGS